MEIILKGEIISYCCFFDFVHGQPPQTKSNLPNHENLDTYFTPKCEAFVGPPGDKTIPILGRTLTYLDCMESQLKQINKQGTCTVTGS